MQRLLFLAEHHSHLRSGSIKVGRLRCYFKKNCQN
ncbi:hypothetical protein CBNA_0790 [Coxiella burnetii str. Namibia]|nr:hypothetical protein CBNA_0790 [Coxiella burnetii str. Namibia]